jgi:hypothetical protein
LRYLNTERLLTNLIGTNMPPSTYKPLFNRRYLFWLIWAIAIAIVLLSATGREKPRQAFAISWQAEPPLWRMSIDSQSHYQLDALLSTPTPSGLAGRQLQATHYHALQQRLTLPELQAQLREFGWQPTLIRETALIRLKLEMATPPTQAQLDWLLEQLHTPHMPLSDAEQQRLLAEWRLDIQQPEARLMAELEHWQAVAMPDSHRWQLLLTGPALDAGQDEPDEAMSAAKANALPSAKAYQLDGYAATPYQLLAWPAPAMTDATSLALNRAAISALQLALNQQNTQRNYRLIWQPLPPQSYLVLILNEPLVSTTSAAIPQLLGDEISDSLLLQAQEQLLEQLAVRYSHPDFQRQWLELTALLGLPPGSELTYATALQQLTADSIRQQLQQLLNADHQLSVTLKPF